MRRYLVFLFILIPLTMQSSDAQIIGIRNRTLSGPPNLFVNPNDFSISPWVNQNLLATTSNTLSYKANDTTGWIEQASIAVLASTNYRVAFTASSSSNKTVTFTIRNVVGGAAIVNTTRALTTSATAFTVDFTMDGTHTAVKPQLFITNGVGLVITVQTNTLKLTKL